MLSFFLVAYFILHAIRFSLFFNTFWHQACLPSLYMSLLLDVSQVLQILYHVAKAIIVIYNDTVWVEGLMLKD